MESGIVKRNFKKSCTFRQKAEKQRKYVVKWVEKQKIRPETFQLPV